MDEQSQAEQVQTVVIGAGQAGLSVGHHLGRLGLPFVILESHDRIGDAWRERWDSLTLFTPARYDGLVGMPFPAGPHSFPTKDEMADYLQAYATRFALPVRTGVTVTRLSRDGARFLVETTGGPIAADNVIIAMATYQNPRVPAFAAELDPAVTQMHSTAYRSPAQLQPGGVLIVGAGNSGAEIALEVAGRYPTLLSGRDTGHLPFQIDSPVGRAIVPFIFRVVFHRILTLGTPMGRRAHPKVTTKGVPLIRVKPRQLKAAGVVRVGRAMGVRDGKLLLDDGRIPDVSNVIWCTGFEPSNAWIDLPVFTNAGDAIHERGVVASEPGLYFLGLHFLYAFSSTMIHGIARDAQYVAEALAARASTTVTREARG